MNLTTYFTERRNHRRIHLEQLRVLRDSPSTDRRTRNKLDKKIQYEKRQLAVLDEMWNVG